MNLPTIELACFYAYRYGPWEIALNYRGRLWVAAGTHRTRKPLLFNLHRDPSERFDVAAANPQIVAQIKLR
ncbi:MAG: hypothetical protein CM15mP120_21000 [Pseudomonadota bacterium]|nr:MAG: hypothetical protein CM15mP120_21000 [Pseudomonadota bacterium]